jgi:ATP-dependent Clp endopeptidase proteolytic subunit ClpP
MKIFNLNVKRGADGSKHLDLQIHGVIDGDWMDPDGGVSTSDVISDLQQHLDAKTIGVRINSVGGSAFGGVALYNALQAHPADVVCVVEGLAASAASLVAMAGKTCMGVGAMMMIHPPLTMALGNAAELRRQADVLDKVQEGISAIYSAKTGLSAKDVGDLVDAETWMTAEEAVSAGFADEVMNDAADGDPDEDEEPDENDPEEGDEDGGEEDSAPLMVGDAVRWRGVEFPISHLPKRFLAMAKKIETPPIIASAPSPAPALAIVPPPAPPAPLSRAELELRAPEILNAVKAEAHAAGVAAERARLQAIDDLGLPAGCAEIANAAKYGEKPTDAPALAMAVVKAGKQAGFDLLAQRRVESRAMADVVTDAPDKTEAQQEAALINAMVQGGNSCRGGK